MFKLPIEESIRFSKVPTLLSDVWDVFPRNIPIQSSTESPSISVKFIEVMRVFLNDPVTISSYRVHSEDFTRNRCLTFPMTCVAILKDRTKPADERISNLFSEGGLGEIFKRPTASAFYQARAKLMPTFFKAWTKQAVQYFYANYPRESLVRTWRGKRLLSVDCSRIVLPDTPQTRSCYTLQFNQIFGPETIYGLASFSYDLLNDIPTDATLEKAKAEKSILINNHLEQFNHEDILILDRGYADYEVLANFATHSIDFVIRFPTKGTFKVVEEFMNSDSMDSIVKIYASSHYKKQVKAGIIPEQVQVRLVKILLDGGETELLVTSLLDHKKFPRADFKWLYGKRWGIESGFLRFKKQLEVEYFSSRIINNILQDFYAAFFMQMLEAILDKEQDRIMRTESKAKMLKHVYHVNKAAAYGIISNNLVSLFLLEEAAMIKRVSQIHDEIKRCKSPIRPHRHIPREFLTPARHVNYLLYRKRRR